MHQYFTAAFFKRSKSALLALILGSVSVQAQVLPENGLLAHYPFLNSTEDISTNANDIPLTGTSKDVLYAADRFGNSNQSGYFNGGGDMPLPALTFATPNSFSFTMWLRSDVVNVRQPIAAANPIGQPFQWMSLSVAGGLDVQGNNTNPQIIIGLNDGTRINELTATVEPSVFGNFWYFVAVVVDNGVVSLYVDDQVLTSQDTPLNMSQMDWNIGNRAGGNSYEYQGALDDISIYDRVLTSEEIESIREYVYTPYVAPPPPIELTVFATDDADNIFEYGELVRLIISAGTVENPLIGLSGIGLQFNLNSNELFSIVGAGALNSFNGQGLLSTYPVSETRQDVVVTGLATGISTSGPTELIQILLQPKYGVTVSASELYYFTDVLLLDVNGNQIATTHGSGTVLYTVIPVATVWPGDADNNGVVESADVLPIGQQYLATGPARSPFNVQWNGYQVDEWSTPAATYADATGDGTVNQNDILPIGLNFGRTRDVNKNSADASVRTIDYAMPAIPANALVTVSLQVGDDAHQLSDVLGLAATLKLPFQPSNVTTPTAGDWIKASPLLTFNKYDEAKNELAFAISRTRQQGGVSGFGDVVTLTFVTTQAIEEGTVLSILNPMVSTTTTLTAATSVSTKVDWSLVTSNEEFDVVAKTITLNQNYPNPFNPSSVIEFSVPQTTQVRLTVFDMLGREVMILSNGSFAAGKHAVTVDASKLSSGVYLYRLQAGTQVMQKMMTLIK